MAAGKISFEWPGGSGQNILPIYTGTDLDSGGGDIGDYYVEIATTNPGDYKELNNVDPSLPDGYKFFVKAVNL